MSQHPSEDEHVGSLTGAYALDALDPLERARVERHLSTCDTCRAEVRSFHETTARLAGGAATTPPSGLRDRVLAEAARTRQVPPTVQGARRGPRASRAATAWLAAAAAVLLVLTVAAGGLVWRVQQDAAAARAFAAAVSEALTSPDRELVTTPFGEGRATVVVSGEEITLIGQEVPPPGDEQALQLWFIGPEGPRPSVLLERVDSDTVWAQARGLRPGDALAVTVEPEGGSRTPTSDPILFAEPTRG